MIDLIRTMGPLSVFAVTLLITLVVWLLTVVYRWKLIDRERQLAAVAVAYEEFNDAVSHLDGDDPYISEDLHAFVDHLADIVHDEDYANYFVDNLCKSLKDNKPKRRNSEIVSGIHELSKTQPRTASNIETAARNASIILMFRWPEPAARLRNVAIEAMMRQADDRAIDALGSAKRNGWKDHNGGALGANA